MTPRRQIGGPDVEHFIRRMSIVCGADARLAAAIQSFDEETNLVILLKAGIRIVKTHQ